MWEVEGYRGKGCTCYTWCHCTESPCDTACPLLGHMRAPLLAYMLLPAIASAGAPPPPTSELPPINASHAAFPHTLTPAHPFPFFSPFLPLCLTRCSSPTP
jgi:hypothetical protein